MKISKIKLLVVAFSLVFFCSAEAFASIVVRAVLVNPSATQKRIVPFRSYLPKEVKPDNVIDMGGLDIAYDPKEGSYYVFREYELQPKETVTIEIELEDVWKIPQEDITSLRQEAERVTKIMANTDYYERANYLKNSIESKLTQIEHSQSVQNPNPGGYISDFRENSRLIESVKSDLTAAKTLVAEAKAIAPMLTWKLIIAVLIFLGILGLVFFIVWQKQIKTLSELTEDYGAPEKPESISAAEEGERRGAAEEKKSGISDIEKRLKE